MGRFVRKFVGYACIGCTYQTVKKTVKSNSIVGSGFYSGLAGLFVSGAYRFLEDGVLLERLEYLLAQENPELAGRMRNLLCQKIPTLEKRVQTKGEERYSMQELKKQIMEEKGYRV